MFYKKGDLEIPLHVHHTFYELNKYMLFFFIRNHFIRNLVLHISKFKKLLELIFVLRLSYGIQTLLFWEIL